MNGVVGWYGPATVTSGTALQAALAAMSATGNPPPLPHHPITCAGPLRYDEDGRLSCDHASVGPDDQRTQLVLDHSVALLILSGLHEQPEGTIP